jgi:hypothetical protein
VPFQPPRLVPDARDHGGIGAGVGYRARAGAGSGRTGIRAAHRVAFGQEGGETRRTRSSLAQEVAEARVQRQAHKLAPMGRDATRVIERAKGGQKRARLASAFSGRQA